MFGILASISKAQGYIGQALTRSRHPWEALIELIEISKFINITKALIVTSKNARDGGGRLHKEYFRESKIQRKFSTPKNLASNMVTDVSRRSNRWFI